MKKIGIVIAMEEEFQAIENKIKEIKIHEEKGLKFFEGKDGFPAAALFLRKQSAQKMIVLFGELAQTNWRKMCLSLH